MSDDRELSDDKWFKELDKRMEARAGGPLVSNGNGSQIADRPFDDVEKEYYKQLYDDGHDEARRLNEHLEDMATRRDAWRRIAMDLRHLLWESQQEVTRLKIELGEPGEHSDA